MSINVRRRRSVGAAKPLLELVLIVVTFVTICEHCCAEEWKSSGALISISLGQFRYSEVSRDELKSLEEFGVFISEPPNDAYQKMPLASFGLGYYFFRGKSQIEVDLLLTSSKLTGEKGNCYTSTGEYVPCHTERYYIGLLAKYRQRLLSRLYASVGGGWLERTADKKADDANIGGSISQGGDMFPAISWGGDIRINSWLLLGFDNYIFMSQSGHDNKPFWNLLTFHSTLLLQ